MSVEGALVLKAESLGSVQILESQVAPPPLLTGGSGHRLYYMDGSVLLRTKTLVESIHHFARDISGVLSI